MKQPPKPTPKYPNLKKVFSPTVQKKLKTRKEKLENMSQRAPKISKTPLTMTAKPKRSK